jgi:MinD-like ATPase involved in chromosome partitioning or flagellar assembly
MSDRLTITLAGPAGRILVSAPIDVDVDELLPEFVALAASGATGAGWRLANEDGRAFPVHATLGESGVRAGSVLLLLPNAGAGERPPTGPEPDVPEIPTPPIAPVRPLRERTMLLLPSRLTCGRRTAEALRALHPGRSDAPTDTRDPPAAALSTPLALPRTPSPLQRVREAWARAGYAHRLDERVTMPRLERCVTIAIVSPKGGPGKTTITALLGSLLAYLRADRVIAVDANPDFGSLGRRLAPNHPVFLDDLLTGALSGDSLTATQLDAQLGRGPHGLMIAPAPTDPRRAKALDEHAYRTAFERFSLLAGVLILDCGTGLDAPPARAALACADQLVLVTDGEPDTASLVCEAADWLRDQAPPLVLLVNKLQRGSQLDIPALERRIAFARGIVEVPHEPAGAQQLVRGSFSWAAGPRAWRIPIRELAALLTDDWPKPRPRPTRARSPSGGVAPRPRDAGRESSPRSDSTL